MRRTSAVPGKQLGLMLEPEVRHPLAKETHEALIRVLADLLLEAYGENTAHEELALGGENEPEDHA